MEMQATEKCESLPRFRASSAQTKIWVIVTLRDDTCYSFRFPEWAKGQDVMDEVCDRLGIVEKDYFGLQYSNSRGEIHWLNKRNRVTRQLAKPEPFSLIFCVKFYVPPHQLLQDSTRHQFFLNIRNDLLNGKYRCCEDLLAKLHALLAQAFSGDFRENHIYYNPSKFSSWSAEFKSKVVLEHCMLKGVTAVEAECCCLREVAELPDYGVEFYPVRSDDTNEELKFGIGVDSLRIEKDDTFAQSIPYTYLRMARRSGKTVRIDIDTSEEGVQQNIVYRLSSKEAANALYRSITEHHAFYRCDSICPAVKEQVARDFFDTVLSWFYHDDHTSERNYIFDTERTCREAYDHARRILYNFGASTIAALNKLKSLAVSSETPSSEMSLEVKLQKLTDKLECWKESFICAVCRDQSVNVVIQCGHLICSDCVAYCESCPLCRTIIETTTKFYMPVNMNAPVTDDQLQNVQSMEDLSHIGSEDVLKQCSNIE